MSMCELKSQMNTLLQDYYEEYNRMNEARIQQKCETDLELRSLMDTVRDNEKKERDNLTKIIELEKEISSKNKVIHDYEVMIRNLEDKLNEIQCEKKEEGRFDMLRVQANDILDKEKEIERLEKLLQKTKEGDKNTPKTNEGDKNTPKTKEKKTILELIDTKNIELVHSPEATKADVEQIEYGVLASEIVADRMAAGIAENIINEKSLELTTEDQDKESEKELSEEELSEEEEEYEILTYRKKEYWIKKGEEPQYVYEVLEEDGLGGKLGVYKKGDNGKMKVVLNKK